MAHFASGLLLSAGDGGVVDLLMAAVGLIAGAIDAVAGGGGMITLPAFSILLGSGPLAIGTNKIAGAAAAGVALFVYSRKIAVDWKRAFAFAAVVAVGSGIGSRVAFSVPPHAYRWIIAGAAPCVLWIVWRKHIWIENSGQGHPEPASLATVALLGVACGFYDGIAGPGGGTLMFLCLLLGARLPILGALAVSKLANLGSALTALASFAASGAVSWSVGMPMAVGVSAGAFVGANIAARNAGKWARAALTCVAVLLALKLALD